MGVFSITFIITLQADNSNRKNRKSCHLYF